MQWGDPNIDNVAKMSEFDVHESGSAILMTDGVSGGVYFFLYLAGML